MRMLAFFFALCPAKFYGKDASFLRVQIFWHLAENLPKKSGRAGMYMRARFFRRRPTSRGHPPIGETR